MDIFSKTANRKNFRLSDLQKSAKKKQTANPKIEGPTNLKYGKTVTLVRTVMLRNLLLFRWCTCLLVLFRLLLIAFALLEDGKFISVYGYTWKFSCSLTIFHHANVLLLSYKCD